MNIEISILLNELHAMTAERDALQARIDGGVRVASVYYRGSYDCKHYASEQAHNATLIPDEGAEL